MTLVPGVFPFCFGLSADAPDMPNAAIMTTIGAEACGRFAPYSFPLNGDAFGLDRYHCRFVSPPSQIFAPRPD